MRLRNLYISPFLWHLNKDVGWWASFNYSGKSNHLGDEGTIRQWDPWSLDGHVEQLLNPSLNHSPTSGLSHEKQAILLESLFRESLCSTSLVYSLPNIHPIINFQLPHVLYPQCT